MSDSTLHQSTPGGGSGVELLRSGTFLACGYLWVRLGVVGVSGILLMGMSGTVGSRKWRARWLCTCGGLGTGLVRRCSARELCTGRFLSGS